MGKKVTYRVQNWRAYNQSLKNRYRLTVWFNEEALEQWYAGAESEKGPGRPLIYSDVCIELGLTLRNLFGLPLRGTEGFLISILEMMNLSLGVPDYTRFSRRGKNLKVDLSAKSRSRALDLVIDSTGLKIYGEGEWKMRTHGKQKRRTWRKLHLAMDPESFQTISMEVTKATTTDGKVMPKLLEDQKKVKNVYADGAYTEKDCFEAIVKVGAKARIALRSGTSLARDPTAGLKERNRLVKEIWDHGGKVLWKKESDYHQRSLAETQMYRFKTIFGGNLSSRDTKNQITEARVKMSILNRMSQLGMPETLAVQAA